MYYQIYVFLNTRSFQQLRLNTMHKLIALLATLLISQISYAQESELTEKINEAMASEIREESERDRDRNRRPAQTLEFFGLTTDMKVLELIPGGGWYTKLLAPTLREDGELHVAIGTTRVKEQLIQLQGMDKINVIEIDAEIESSDTPRLRTIGEFSFGEDGFDAVLTFRNMHNFDAAGRNSVNEAVFEALEPGGIYGVVDHTLRHMEPFSSENRRRADPVLMIKEIQAAGFEFVDYSDVHYRPDDELRFEVGRKSVTGNTDRFTLLFVKPK